MNLTNSRSRRRVQSPSKARPFASTAQPHVISGAAELLSELPKRLEDQDMLRLATLGLLTVGVAHDLGNLLQVVASAVRLIERELDAEVRTKLEPLTRSALMSVDRASALSRQILDLSQAKAALAEVTCLDRTLMSIEELVRLTAGPKVVLEMALHGALPPVICNTRELENAILNLVINARDAMPRGGRLLLSTHRDAAPLAFGPDRSMAVLRVSDNGCGVSPEVARQVFQPFFTTKTDGRGTGLGLAMVSDFARRAGGSAELDSAVGRGSTVTLRLPGCR